MIDIGLYRRFYRQKRRSFAGAGEGTIREGATFLTPSSIRYKDTEKAPATGGVLLHTCPKPARRQRLKLPSTVKRVRHSLPPFEPL